MGSDKKASQPESELFGLVVPVESPDAETTKWRNESLNIIAQRVVERREDLNQIESDPDFPSPITLYHQMTFLPDLMPLTSETEVQDRLRRVIKRHQGTLDAWHSMSEKNKNTKDVDKDTLDKAISDFRSLLDDIERELELTHKIRAVSGIRFRVSEAIDLVASFFEEFFKIK